MQQALSECTFCGEKLATGGRSVLCSECDAGFHLDCAERADELTIETTSRLLRADSHAIVCPDCGNTWEPAADLGPYA